MKLGSCQRRRSSLVEKVGHGTKSSQSGIDESPPHPRREDGQRRQRGDRRQEKGGFVSVKDGVQAEAGEGMRRGFGAPALALEEAHLRSDCRKR